MLQQFGTPAEIYNNPVNMFVADFMGSPAMNLIPATIGAQGNALTVKLERGEREPISLPLTDRAGRACRPIQGKQVIFGIRPEALTDPDGADRNATSIATADCHIEVVEPAGSDTFAVTNLGGKRGGGAAARRRQHPAGHDDAAGLQPDQGGVLRSGRTGWMTRILPWRSRDGASGIRRDIVIIGSGIGQGADPRIVSSAGLGGDAAARTDPRSWNAASASPPRRRRATRAPSSSTAISGRRRCGARPAASAFNPGNYYYVGGNSKLYGAVLFRYRKEDFSEMEHFGGVSPAWPFPYEEFEPWYSKAEQLFRVRGALGEDPTEPFHSQPYPFPPVPDEPPIARARAELKALGLHPASLPLGVDIEAWLKGGKTRWDAFPNTGAGKMDAESAAAGRGACRTRISSS